MQVSQVSHRLDDVVDSDPFAVVDQVLHLVPDVGIRSSCSGPGVLAVALRAPSRGQSRDRWRGAWVLVVPFRARPWWGTVE